MFSKRLSDVTAEDVHAVVASQVPEGSEVEFKETLPSKVGEDPWFKDQQQVGDRARNELLAEVIAFANAFGGTLVLGIAETDDKPARAKAVMPLPKCVELADRLRLQCRDCIEPQIPMLEVTGVPMGEDGAGVVVLRASRSRMAPHRHTVSRECYVRRADRTEKMTMREIQDLTLHVERGIAAIDAEFIRSATRFTTTFEAFRKSQRALGVRVTGVPLVPIAIENLQRSPKAQLPVVRLLASLDGSKTTDLVVPAHHINWRPTLRAVHGRNDSDTFCVELLGRASGGTDYMFLTPLSAVDGRARVLYPSWFMGLVGNCLCGIEQYRRLAGAMEVEYALEVEVITTEEVPVGKYGGGVFYGDTLGPFPSGRTVFPRYSVGAPSDFAPLCGLIERDFWNACGHAWEGSLLIDFDRALHDLGMDNASR